METLASFGAHQSDIHLRRHPQRQHPLKPTFHTKVSKCLFRENRNSSVFLQTVGNGLESSLISRTGFTQNSSAELYKHLHFLSYLPVLHTHIHQHNPQSANCSDSLRRSLCFVNQRLEHYGLSQRCLFTVNSSCVIYVSSKHVLFGCFINEISPQLF